MGFFSSNSFNMFKIRPNQGGSVSADWVYRVTNFINNFTVKNGQFYFDGFKAELTTSSGGDASFDKVDFATSSSGKDVTVNSGFVIQGYRQVLSLPKTIFTITKCPSTVPQTIYVEISVDDTTTVAYDRVKAELKKASDLPLVQSDLTVFKWPLASYYNESGETASLLRIHHLGSIIMPGTYA